MLTQCPACSTIYHLEAGELSAARGFVECGECRAQFNALERLADEPTFPSPAETNTSLADEAAVHRPAQTPPLPSVDNNPTPITSPSPEQAQTAVSDERREPDVFPAIEVSESEQFVTTTVDATPYREDRHTPASGSDAELDPIVSDHHPNHSLSEAEHAILFTEPGTGEGPEVEDADIDLAELDPDDVPAVLADEISRLQQPRGRSLGSVWVVLSIVFGAMLAVQLAWLLRDSIVSVYPQSFALYAGFCQTVGCRVDTLDRRSEIELLARDVRDHPQYRDTLLVNATLISRSQTVTYFPTIQLGIYGPTGEVIGVRRFAPQAYLDTSIDVESGMPPNRPVYVVMEIAGVDAGAVSFEFEFL